MQWSAADAHNFRVGGSNPPPATINLYYLFLYSLLNTSVNTDFSVQLPPALYAVYSSALAAICGFRGERYIRKPSKPNLGVQIPPIYLRGILVPHFAHLCEGRQPKGIFNIGI